MNKFSNGEEVLIVDPSSAYFGSLGKVSEYCGHGHYKVIVEDPEVASGIRMPVLKSEFLKHPSYALTEDYEDEVNLVTRSRLGDDYLDSLSTEVEEGIWAEFSELSTKEKNRLATVLTQSDWDEVKELMGQEAWDLAFPPDEVGE